jgi:hypothetical protein
MEKVRNRSLQGFVSLGLKSPNLVLFLPFKIFKALDLVIHSSYMQLSTKRDGISISCFQTFTPSVISHSIMLGCLDNRPVDRKVAETG